MPEATLTINDSDLLKLLSSSLIDDAQKEELENLMPEMNEEEKGELLELIHRSNDEAKEINDKYQGQLKEVNEELGEKFNTLTKESNERSSKELEKLDIEKGVEEMKDIEAEVAAADEQKKTNNKNLPLPSLNKEGPTRSDGGGPKHTTRNLILILIILFALAGGILFALTNLI